jgi:hypothetical protein
MSRLVPLAAIVLLGTLSVARADVYRWIDDKGVPHYSDQWVPGSTVIKTSKVRPDSDTLGQPRGPGNPADRANQVVADQSNAHAVQQDVAKSRDAQCKACSPRAARYPSSIRTRRSRSPSRFRSPRSTRRTPPPSEAVAGRAAGHARNFFVQGARSIVAPAAHTRPNEARITCA